MAKLVWTLAPEKAPSLKGAVIISTWRGIPYLAAWPKKRGPHKDPKQKERVEKFRQVGKLNIYANPEQQLAAREATKGTPFYTRDVLTMVQYGTLFSWREADGKVYYSMSTQQQVSQSLDVLGQVPGSLILRGSDSWQAFPPSGLYQVPTVVTPGGAPVMTPPGPELGGHAISSMPRTTQNAGTTAAKGVYFKPMMPIQVEKIIPSFNALNLKTYKCELWEWDGVKLTAKITESPSVVWTGSGFFRSPFTMNDLVTLSAAKQYVAIFLRTDGAGTTNNQCFSSGGQGNNGYPSTELIGWAQWQKTTLAVNDAPASTGQSVPFCIDIIYKF